jgi:hypothetical protein
MPFSFRRRLLARFVTYGVLSSVEFLEHSSLFHLLLGSGSGG